MAGKKYHAEDIESAGRLLADCEGLEKNIIEFWQRYTRRDYNSQSIKAQASDLAEFYEKEDLDNLPSTVGEIGIAIAQKLRDEDFDAAFPAGPLVMVDHYYQKQKKRVQRYGNMIGSFLNRLLSRRDERKAQDFYQENSFHYILHGKELFEDLERLQEATKPLKKRK